MCLAGVCDSTKYVMCRSVALIGISFTAAAAAAAAADGNLP
jgi:hypothetical protein